MASVGSPISYLTHEVLKPFVAKEVDNLGKLLSLVLPGPVVDTALFGARDMAEATVELAQRPVEGKSWLKFMGGFVDSVQSAWNHPLMQSEAKLTEAFSKDPQALYHHLTEQTKTGEQGLDLASILEKANDQAGMREAFAHQNDTLKLGFESTKDMPNRFTKTLADGNQLTVSLGKSTALVQTNGRLYYVVPNMDGEAAQVYTETDLYRALAQAQKTIVEKTDHTAFTKLFAELDPLSTSPEQVNEQIAQIGKQVSEQSNALFKEHMPKVITRLYESGIPDESKQVFKDIKQKYLHLFPTNTKGLQEALEGPLQRLEKNLNPTDISYEESVETGKQIEKGFNAFLKPALDKPLSLESGESLSQQIQSETGLDMEKVLGGKHYPGLQTAQSAMTDAIQAGKLPGWQPVEGQPNRFVHQAEDGVETLLALGEKAPAFNRSHQWVHLVEGQPIEPFAALKAHVNKATRKLVSDSLLGDLFQVGKAQVRQSAQVMEDMLTTLFKPEGGLLEKLGIKITIKPPSQEAAKDYFGSVLPSKLLDKAAKKDLN